MTNYEYIQQHIINNKQKLALFLAQIEDANEWAWTAESSWLPWLDEECKLNYDNYEKYFK